MSRPASVRVGRPAAWRTAGAAGGHGGSRRSCSALTALIAMSTVTGLKPARHCSTCWLAASVRAATRAVAASGSPALARSYERWSPVSHQEPASIQPAQRARPGASARRGMPGSAATIDGCFDALTLALPSSP
jgi:hypothetical protein